MEKKYDIFISYRRLDNEGKTSGRDIARTIKLEFEKRGYKVFFDYSEIKDNEFESSIIPSVKESKYFILVLSKDALKRCKNEDDWVRREISEAIRQGTKIIPVSPEGQFDGWPDTLPMNLYSLKSIQISDISLGSLFEKSIDKIIEDRMSLLSVLPAESKRQWLPRRIQNILVNYNELTRQLLLLSLFFDILLLASFCWHCVRQGYHYDNLEIILWGVGLAGHLAIFSYLKDTHWLISLIILIIGSFFAWSPFIQFYTPAVFILCDFYGNNFIYAWIYYILTILLCLSKLIKQPVLEFIHFKQVSRLVLLLICTFAYSFYMWNYWITEKYSESDSIIWPISCCAIVTISVILYRYPNNLFLNKWLWLCNMILFLLSQLAEYGFWKFQSISFSEWLCGFAWLYPVIIVPFVLMIKFAEKTPLKYRKLTAISTMTIASLMIFGF